MLTTRNSITLAGVWNLREVYDAVMGGYWPNAGSRGVFAGGNQQPVYTSMMDFITMSSSGNASFFGDLSADVSSTATMANFSRMVIAQGTTPASTVNTVEEIIFNTTGNASNFGGASARARSGGTSNSIRGIVSGGGGPSNVIDYCTLES